MSDQPSTAIASNIEVMEQFQREPPGTEPCLGICTEVLDHIATLISPQGSTNSHTSATALATTPQDDLTAAHLMTLSVLKVFSSKLHDAIVRLQSGDISRGFHLPYVPRPTPSGRQASASPAVELDSFAPSQHADERSASRTHVLEHVSVGDHGRQVLRMSAGERWTARSLTVGDGAVQLIGTFSDTSMRECLDRL